MKDKLAAFKEMSDSYKEKQEALGANDEELSSKKEQLSQAKKQKASDEEFLAKLLPMCEEKAKGYENRKVLRANEEAAIAEAISILNSDEAFETFGTTDAAKTGATGFIQLRAVHRHVAGDSHARSLVQKVLNKGVKETHSNRLSKVLALVQAENPFTSVLDEIDKMIELIAQEGKADKENLAFCNKERKENDASLKQKNKDILNLDTKIDKLKTTIGDPKTGLKKQIEDTELALVQNTQSQTEETKERTENNLAYQQDVKNLVSAQGILEKA